MSKRRTDRPTTVDDGTRENLGAQPLSLLVIADGAVATHVLPPSGDVSIGRSSENDVQIDHPTISRRHAVIHVGPRLAIEDLGSANGTRVLGKRLARGEAVPLGFGEVADLGATMVIVQQRARPLRPRRLWTHGYLEARLHEECARTLHGGAPFALLRVQCGVDAATEAVEEGLVEALRVFDVIGYYAPGQYEALLVGCDEKEAERLARRVEERLAARRLGASVGLACCPRDGRDADALLAIASQRTRGDEAAASPIVLEGAMPRLRRMVEHIAASTISVLILGETGAGKEMLAETVHRLSPRTAQPFLRLNCAALSESLLESELFGHERGAFTGAIATKQGLIETADRGTVFLDEVGELPLSMQAKLLRVIEERQVLRVGGLKSRKVDVRFIAATNRDIELEVERKAFRQDLYFRLNGVTLVVPPLRERQGEIAGLAAAFVEHACTQWERKVRPTIAPATLAALLAYRWPGNIRELRNVMERAVLLAGDGPIRPEHLPLDKMQPELPAPAEERPEPPRAAGAEVPRHVKKLLDRVGDDDGAAARRIGREVDRIGREIEGLERDRVLEALEKCAGNQTEAARVLGISRRTLINRLEEYGIPRPRKRPA